MAGAAWVAVAAGALHAASLALGAAANALALLAFYRRRRRVALSDRGGGKGSKKERNLASPRALIRILRPAFASFGGASPIRLTRARAKAAGGFVCRSQRRGPPPPPARSTPKATDGSPRLAQSDPEV
ncbi:Protein of unknown function [Gryllus bimaculatus]|nr:Protein of unknown function [Gryllus bimaculatus]